MHATYLQHEALAVVLSAADVHEVLERLLVALGDGAHLRRHVGEVLVVVQRGEPERRNALDGRGGGGGCGSGSGGFLSGSLLRRGQRGLLDLAVFGDVCSCGLGSSGDN